MSDNKSERPPPFRAIKEHKIGDCKVEVAALDESGPGGASHLYNVAWPEGAEPRGFTVRFQKGAISEAGHNGATNESMIVILIDRLRGFQKGDFNCPQNSIALMKLEEALFWLQSRTRDRIARGVEGKSLA